jgi:hypothetical protein
MLRRGLLSEPSSENDGVIPDVQEISDCIKRFNLLILYDGKHCD